MALSITLLTPHRESAWDAFCRAHPHSSPFHLTAWKRIIEGSFGYRPHYLLAEDGDEVQAIVPLFFIKNLIVGKILLSSPFAVYGGILSTSEAARVLLHERIGELARELNVAHVELRNAHAEQCAGFPVLSRYVTFTQEVRPQTDEELLEALPKKTRNMVRKALKYPYSSRITSDLDSFYSLLSRNYRRLGTPVFPKSYFARMLREFGPEADLREVVWEGKVIAASLNLLYAGQMHTFYAASDQRFLAMAPNNFLYFDHLLWAGRNGYHTFDFGRSKHETGTLEFKRHWLTTMRELPYEVRLFTRTEMPNFTQKNARFNAVTKAWQKMPLPLTRLMGPRLVRLFP
jgi:FemAB-related protein (PEP-CTERM system-associated)